MAPNDDESLIPCEFTKSESYSFKFQWKIEDFFNVPCENREMLKSKDFGVPTSYVGVKWKINGLLFPKGYDEDSKGHMSVYLTIIVKPYKAAKRISANLSLSIITPAGKSLTMEVANVMGTCTYSWDFGFPCFVKLNRLEERQQELLPNGDLTLQFEGKTRVLIDSAISQVSTVPKPTANANVVVDIVKKLFVDGTGSDVVIKARDGEFKGHKWVLSLRCEYFRDIFDSGLTVIDFSKDMNEDELQDLMEYLYFGVASNLVNTCRVLLVVAAVLELEELKSLSEENLIRQLKPDNAWEFLNLGHEQRAKNLEEAALWLWSKCMD